MGVCVGGGGVCPRQARRFAGRRSDDAARALHFACPAQLKRIGTYQTLLQTGLGMIDDAHPGKADLETAHHGWSQLQKEAQEIITTHESDARLFNIALSFPYENLCLVSPWSDESADAADSGKRRTSKTTLGAASHLMRRITAETRRYTYKGNISNATSPMEEAMAKHELRRHTLPPPLSEASSKRRLYLDEGPARVSKGAKASEDKSRTYLFVFSDMLMIARPKGRGIYLLRDLFRLSECWIGPCFPNATGSGFAFGAPHCRDRYFHYKLSTDAKRWHGTITQAIAKAKASAPPQRQVMIYPFVTNAVKRKKSIVSQSTMTPIELGRTETVDDLIRAILHELQVQGNPSDFALFELTEYGLRKCEPFACPCAMIDAGEAIKLHNATCQFVLRNRDAVALQSHMLPPSLQCLVTRGAASPKKSSPGGSGASATSAWGKRLKHGFKKVIDLARKGGDDRKKDASYASPGAGTDAAAVGCLYRRPLGDVLVDGELPRPIQNMLVRLYQDGPQAPGLFRKSANAKLIRQVRERLDAGQEVDMNEVPILAVGAIFKEFLRSMPESVFPGNAYADFIKTNTVSDKVARQQAVKTLVQALPPAHLQLLEALVPVLTRICENEEENSMSARNVGICVGQSLMCPPTTEDVLKNDVPPFMEFLVDNSAEIFGRLAPLPACIKAVEQAGKEDKEYGGDVNEDYLEIIATTPDIFSDEGDEVFQQVGAGSAATARSALSPLGTTERTIVFESPTK